MEIEIDDTYQWGSWTTYKYFACADFDGDGTDELLTFKYEPYNGGMANMNENDSFTDSVYPYFDMYEISESGEVKHRDEEPYKIHGDLWLMGSHQDASFALITEEEYKEEVNVLTGGNRLVKFASQL